MKASFARVTSDLRLMDKVRLARSKRERVRGVVACPKYKRLEDVDVT